VEDARLPQSHRTRPQIPTVSYGLPSHATIPPTKHVPLQPGPFEVAVDNEPSRTPDVAGSVHAEGKRSRQSAHLPSTAPSKPSWIPEPRSQETRG
jgi:hypothetical protein